MVVSGSQKMSSAAKVLKIHESTAKLTMNTFKAMTREEKLRIL